MIMKTAKGTTMGQAHELAAKFLTVCGDNAANLHMLNEILR